VFERRAKLSGKVAVGHQDHSDHTTLPLMKASLGRRCPQKVSARMWRAALYCTREAVAPAAIASLNRGDILCNAAK